MIYRILKIFSIFSAVLLAIALGFYIYLASLNGKRADELSFPGQTINGPIFFAHRGGGREAPENTIEAFENSEKHGIDVLELDVRRSKDGEFVVFHDSNLGRTTNGKGAVGDLKLAELKTLDAGYAFSDDGGKTFPFRGNGVRIPTLLEVFEKFPDRVLNIEIKETDPGSPGELCTLINRSGRQDSVIVASTDTTVLESFRSNCKAVATSAGFRESLWFLFLYKIGLSKNFNADMQALQVPEKLFGTPVITKDFIDAAHERGLKLHIWTANKESDIKRLLDAGVDGVMTDFPRLIVEIKGAGTQNGVSISKGN